jgi:Flp pilus assembly protein protease CpaA
MAGMDPLYFYIAVAVVSVFAAMVAVVDIWKLKIYNLITFPLMLTGVLYHAWVGATSTNPGHSLWQDVTWSVLSILFGFFILLLPYMMGGMSAGDVKLLMAIGAWLSWPATLYVFIASSLAAGACAVIMICWNKSLSETWWNLKILIYRVASMGIHFAADDRVEDVSEAVSQSRRKRLIPFGAMLFLGIISAAIYQWSQDSSRRPNVHKSNPPGAVEVQ